jgi:hypothetical protein
MKAMLRIAYVLLISALLNSCTKTVDTIDDPGTEQPTIVALFHNTVNEPFSAVLGTEAATSKTGTKVTIFVEVHTKAEELAGANISLRDSDSQEVLATIEGSEVTDVVMVPGYNPGREDNTTYYYVSFNLDSGFAHRNMDLIANVTGLATSAQIQMTKAFIVIE